MRATDTKYLLTEAVAMVKKLHNINPSTPKGMAETLANRNAFSVYLKGLCEGLHPDSVRDFVTLATNTRTHLLENSFTQLTPYETMTMPILRNFYPKLIAKELVNVMPIDKPEVIKTFMRPKFRKMISESGTAEYTGYDYEFPSTSTDISKGYGIGFEVAAEVPSGASVNILDEFDSTIAAHVEKSFVISAVIDASTSTVTAVTIRADVDGNFGAQVTLAGDVTDFVSGHINFKTGTLNWSSTGGLVSDIRYKAYVSLEENTANPEAEFDFEKIRFVVDGRRITTRWSVEMEQDAKALFDLQFQSEIINTLGEQIALDIDREIITDLIDANTASNPGSHTVSFDKTPPTGYAWGPKMWYENILPTLNELSAQIYNSTFIGAANTIACNPLDSSIFESLNSYEYLGDSTAGGDVGYRSATVASGKWKILVSPLIPSGKMIVKYRSTDIQRAAYVYAPYVPALLIPYPLGNNPSLTVMTRYAKRVIRHKALGVLNITAS